MDHPGCPTKNRSRPGRPTLKQFKSMGAVEDQTSKYWCGPDSKWIFCPSRISSTIRTSRSMLGRKSKDDSGPTPFSNNFCGYTGKQSKAKQDEWTKKIESHAVVGESNSRAIRNSTPLPHTTTTCWSGLYLGHLCVASRKFPRQQTRSAPHWEKQMR